MKRIGLGEVVLFLAGLTALAGSFLPFYTFADGDELTVWQRGLFPTAAVIAIACATVGIEAAVLMVLGRDMQSPFLNFSWGQLRLAAGGFATLLSICYAVQFRGGSDLGTGYALIALGSFGTLAGGVLSRRDELMRTTEPSPIVSEGEASLEPGVAASTPDASTGELHVVPEPEREATAATDASDRAAGASDHAGLEAGDDAALEASDEGASAENEEAEQQHAESSAESESSVQSEATLGPEAQPDGKVEAASGGDARSELEATRDE